MIDRALGFTPPESYYFQLYPVNLVLLQEPVPSPESKFKFSIYKGIFLLIQECKNSIKIKSQPKPISSIPTVLMSCLSEDVNSTFISPTLIKTEKYSSLWSLTKKMPIKSTNLVALILILQSSSISSWQTPKTDFNKKFKYQSNMLFNMKFILKNQDSLYKRLLKVIKVKEPWNHLSEKENLHSSKELLSFKKKNLQLKTDNQ